MKEVITKVLFRDQCPCQHCVHPETRQRQIDPFEACATIGRYPGSILIHFFLGQFQYKGVYPFQGQEECHSNMSGSVFPSWRFFADNQSGGDDHKSDYPIKTLSKRKPKDFELQRRGVVE